jgi:iron complex transport system ATP-binding protein
MALETLQITHLKNRMFTRISGGERQLVLIARALAQQAKTLLMDEPTASLDYGNQMRVMEKIKGLSEKGYTIIQSTHNPEQTLWYADRVLALQKGQLISEGAPSEVMDTDLLKQLYQVDVQIEALHEGRISVCLPQKLLNSGNSCSVK